MPLSEAEVQKLLRAARRVRETILEIVQHSGSGHLGGSLSEVDLLVGLYHRALRFDPRRPDDPARDRFVLSKGHGGLGLAAVFADLGVIPRAELAEFGKTGARLGMHMDHARVPGVEASTGSLGHGVGIALGMALGARVLEQDWRVFCLASDGEMQEGSIWEAALLGARRIRRGRLTLIVDRNLLTMDGDTEGIVPIEPLAAKWEAFGWRAHTIDGHDPSQIAAALDAATSHENDRPHIVIANTIKGKGVEFMEGEPKWHYGSLDTEMHARAMASIASLYESPTPWKRRAK